MRLKFSQTVSKLATPISTAVSTPKVESKEDLPRVEEHKSPELFELLQKAAASDGHIKAVWATKNLIIIYDKLERKEILFDIEKNKIIKSIQEQVLSTNTRLYQSTVNYLENRPGYDTEEVKKKAKSEISDWTRNLFLPIRSRLFAIDKYQFLNISENDIRLWDTSNPEQMQLVKTFKTPISSEDLEETAMHARDNGAFDETPWFFEPQVFPDKSHIMVISNRKNYNFMDSKTGETFTVTLNESWDTASIINNHQVLLDKSSGDGYQSCLLTIDFKEKSAKLHKDKPLINKDKKSERNPIPLSFQVILRIDEDFNFNGFEVSSDGALIPIPSLQGCIPYREISSEYSPLQKYLDNHKLIQLDKGEFIYWDKKKKELRLIDPFAQRIISLLKIDSVTSIFSNGREILVLTPTQLHRCFIPDHQQRLLHTMDKHLSISGIKNIVMDYAGFNHEDNPHLLTELSFLTVPIAENQAKPFAMEINVQIKFMDTTIWSPQPVIDKTVTVAFSRQSFRELRKKIIETVKVKYGVILNTKDIPHVEIRLNGNLTDEPCVGDTIYGIRTKNFTDHTFITVSLPVDKIRELKQAKEIAAPSASPSASPSA